jgi:hypothetical protein
MARTCSVDGCDREVRRRVGLGGTHGLCHIHYQLWLQAGAPIQERLEDTPPPLEDRIREVRAWMARLQARIAETSGEQHVYVQHDDLNFAWCDACGYTETGLHKSECGLRSKYDRRFDWHRDSDLHLDELPSRVRDR